MPKACKASPRGCTLAVLQRELQALDSIGPLQEERLRQGALLLRAQVLRGCRPWVLAQPAAQQDVGLNLVQLLQ